MDSQIALITITNTQHDHALYVNGEYISSEDETFEWHESLAATASNLSDALNIPVTKLCFEVEHKDDWCWDEVADDLAKEGKLYDPTRFVSQVDHLVNVVYESIRQDLITVTTCAETVRVERKDTPGITLQKNANEEDSLWKVSIDGNYLMGVETLHDGFAIGRLVQNLPKRFEVDAMSNGENPNGIVFEVEVTGDKGIYQEVSVTAKKGEDYIAQIMVGLSEKGEVRILTTEGGDGDRDHSFAVFPEKEHNKGLYEYWY